MNTKFINKTNVRKKKMGGWNTADMSGTVLLAAVIIAAIGGSTYALTTGQKKDEVVNTMVTAMDRARARMSNFPDKFTSFNNATCYQSSLFPESWKSDTSGQFNTPISDNGLTCGSANQAVDLTGVTTTGTGKFAKFTLSGLSEQQCNEIGAGLLSKFVEVDVNDTRIDGNATLLTQCAAGDSGSNSIAMIGQ